MRRIPTRNILVLGACFLTAGATPGCSEDVAVKVYGSGAVHQYIQWQGPLGELEATGLHLADIDPLGMVTRLLVLDPTHRAVVLTHFVDPRRGRQSAELRDDRTGWWARVDMDSELNAETLGAYFSRSIEESDPEKKNRGLVRLTTSDGFRFERELPEDEPSKLQAALARDLVDAGHADRLRSSLPRGLDQTIAFLAAPTSQDSTTGSGGSSVLGSFLSMATVEVLKGVLEIDEETRSRYSKYTTTAGKMRKGLGPLDPAERRLTSRFRSVDENAPLDDSRAKDVFARSDMSTQ